MFDVMGVGDLLIDFTPAGERKNPLYEMNPGGSAANCMAACARLGARVEFACAVGEDMFGDFLEASLNKLGIGTRSLVKRKEEHTTLVFVSLDDNAVPQYSFVKEKNQHVIKESEFNYGIVSETKIFTFSLVAFSTDESRGAVLKAIKLAKSMGKKIGFDANYRTRQWADEEKAVKCMRECIELADIIKMSENEAELVTGLSDYAAAAEAVGKETEKLVCVTVGAEGIWYYHKGEKGHVDAVKVNAVDTTGCGDSFMGAMLYQEACEPDKTAEEKIRFAAAAAAICATGFGGLPSMPTLEQVKGLLRK